MNDYSILLIKGDENIHKVLGISLADIGYKVIVAENGDAAIDLFRENKPHIVIADIKMLEELVELRDA